MRRFYIKLWLTTKRTRQIQAFPSGKAPVQWSNPPGGSSAQWEPSLKANEMPTKFSIAWGKTPNIKIIYQISTIVWDHLGSAASPIKAMRRTALIQLMVYKYNASESINPRLRWLNSLRSISWPSLPAPQLSGEMSKPGSSGCKIVIAWWPKPYSISCVR